MVCYKEGQGVSSVLMVPQSHDAERLSAGGAPLVPRAVAWATRRMVRRMQRSEAWEDNDAWP
jgi:hypothetical protein